MVTHEGSNSVVKLVNPDSLGWLRRPELDTMLTEVWELPNGELYPHEKRRGLLWIAVYKDE